LLLLGSLAGIMAAGGASAARLDSDAPSVVVKYEGVYALYRRITAAARRVCPDAPIRNLGLQTEVEHCRNQAIARAIRQIDNSRLAALHAAHSKNG
jgi:UrcA family protein